jgi:zinc protease
MTSGLALDLHERRLDNGLRVVVNPDRSANAVCIGVCYDVGSRSEPKGRTGFAHLFEHLMFQGSENVPKFQFDKLITGNGGVNNGWTRDDFTFYFEMVPPNALELMLFLEADRMGRLELSQENLENQIAVVKEEILVNVLNQPYGGFPWLDLPQAAFRTFPNAHNSYGDFRDLEASTLDDARDFYEKYYAPENAALVVAGAVEPEAAFALIDKHLGEIPARPVPQRPDFGEPLSRREKRVIRYDEKAPEPALAVGYRVPDPEDEWDDYLAMVLAADVLSEGDPSRLYQRLVKRDRVATAVGGSVGLMVSPFETRDPALFAITVEYLGKPDPDRILAPLDEEIEFFCRDGATSEELDRFRSSTSSSYVKAIDNVVSRTDFLATLSLMHGSPRLVNELIDELARPEPDRVRRVAEQWLKPNTRTIIDLRPGKAP